MVIDDRLERPTILVIFGISGDLARQKLLPAIYHLVSSGKLSPENFLVVGVSRQKLSVKDIVSPFIKQAGKDKVETKVFSNLFSMFQMDLTLKDDYFRLKQTIKELESSRGWKAQKLIYLSMPPQIFGPVIDLLGEAGLNALPSRNTTKLLIEKPFGYDLTSAQELIDRVSAQFSEGQIYRIDHYLAKETAQNILAFRFHNPLFATIWHRRSVEKIIITASEKIGIEGRVVFYEQTGALRDLIQSHLLQLLALATMEEPSRLNASRIRAEKLKVLRAIEPALPSQAIRAQYDGYRKEVGSQKSLVETFAALRLTINNARWRDVPIVLQTGKYLAEKSTTIEVYFKNTYKHGEGSNKLIIRLQPDEGIGLGVYAKVPGFTSKTELVDMDFSYGRVFEMRQPDAYERVLFDAIRGEQTLFASSSEVIASWQVIQPVIDAWQADSKIKLYPKGTLASELSGSLY